MTRIRMAPRTATVTTKRTVTVACKVPNGLVMKLYKMVPKSEPVLGGGYRDFNIAEQVGEEIKLRGPAVPWGMMHPNIIHGVRLNYNIPADFFAEWMRQNANADYIKNGLVYAYENKEDVEARAKEEVNELSGLEPIDVSTITVKGVTKLADVRIPKSVRTELSPIQKGDKEMTEN